jgi:16S rRNA (adenine1518-N6/adenine1519-N6)-dimethyltransferase
VTQYSPAPDSRIRARKRFGQHFLHDQGVISDIISAIDPQVGDRLIEIGPGLGALTLPLLTRCQTLEVVELDRDVIPILEARAAPLGKLTVHAADVLKVDFKSLSMDSRQLRLCGNLPYNISTPLLFHVLSAAAFIKDMHFMLQKEVVMRMAASPDTSDYGRLTVMLAVHCHVEHLFNVGPEAFRPPPKVNSSVVRLLPHAAPPFQIDDTARFAQVVAAAFGQRRKTLRNSLRGVVDNAGFEATLIDPSRRAETLSPADFARLSNTKPPELP